MQTSDWQAIDQRHYLHPFTDYKGLAAVGSRIITRAEGVYLWDSEDNRILDGMAGLWCVNVGYGRRALAEVARDQLCELPYYNSFFQTAHPPAIELSGLLADITPAGLNRAFYTNSGSEANDTVIRMVRRYWDLVGQPQKKVIISRIWAYHGSTMGAGSLTGMPEMHAQGGLPIADIEHIHAPYSYRYSRGMPAEEFGLNSARALEAKIQQLGVERVAAFIGEPVQCAGGVIIPPSSYWPEIRRICEEYGILLVVDEVICGFGRMGTWFGSDYYGLQPDLMPIAKGLSSGYLPIGGVMISDRIAQVLIDEGGEFQHGFTYSGHPAACAVAAANIRILQDEKIVDYVHENIGPYFRQKWTELGEHPLVGEARSAGLLGALELVNKRAKEHAGVVGTRCKSLCMENGLVMRSVGDVMIVSPPLVISKAEVDELVALARKGLDLTVAELVQND